MGLRNFFIDLILICLSITHRTDIVVKEALLTLNYWGLHVRSWLFDAISPIWFLPSLWLRFYPFMWHSWYATLYCITFRWGSHFLLRFERQHRFLLSTLECYVCYCVFSSWLYVVSPKWGLSWELLWCSQCLWSRPRFCLWPNSTLIWLYGLWSMPQITWSASWKMWVLIHIICLYLLSNSSCLLERDLSLSHRNSFWFLFNFWHF